MTTHLPIQQPDRRCGHCTACCTTHAVAAIGKPEFKRCEHLRGSTRGCGTYATRPDSCRDWACLWLTGVGVPSDRPDKLGVVLDAQWSEPLECYVIKVFEARPGAASKPRVAALVQRLAAAQGRGIAVLYKPGGRRTIIGGDEASIKRAVNAVRDVL